jgi:hypothetical protein
MTVERISPNAQDSVASGGRRNPGHPEKHIDEYMCVR